MEKNKNLGELYQRRSGEFADLEIARESKRITAAAKSLSYWITKDHKFEAQVSRILLDPEIVDVVVHAKSASVAYWLGKKAYNSLDPVKTKGLADVLGNPTVSEFTKEYSNPAVVERLTFMVCDTAYRVDDPVKALEPALAFSDCRVVGSINKYGDTAMAVGLANLLYKLFETENSVDRFMYVSEFFGKGSVVESIESYAGTDRNGFLRALSDIAYTEYWQTPAATQSLFVEGK